MTDDEKTIDEIEQQDAAFLASGNPPTLPFHKGPVEPFDSYRQTAAQKCGMEFLNMSDEAIEEFQARKTYDGILWDAVLCCYLMSQPRSVSLKALRKPQAVISAAAKWQNDHDITLGSDNHAAVLDVWGDVIGTIFDSMGEIDDSAKGDDDPLGKSSAE